MRLPFSRPVLRRAGWLFWHALVVTAALGSNTVAWGYAKSPPPCVSDKGLSSELRQEVGLALRDLRDGKGGRRVAQKRIEGALSRGLSAHGKRFRNEFPRGFHVDATRKDVAKVVNNFLGGNAKNWHGYLRELKYMNTIESPGSHFRLGEVGTRKKIVDGRLVEFDIEAIHKETGQKIAIESKDWRIDSKAKLEKAKKQIDKIVKRARKEGVSRVVWVNRQMIPEEYREELLAYARKKKVGLYDEMSTGRRTVSVGKARSFDDEVLEKESRRLLAAAKKSGRNVAGKRAISASAKFARALRGAGKAAGPVLTAYECCKGVYAVVQWQGGRTTTREFIGQAGAAGGGAAGAAGGAMAGAWVGGAIGSVVPVVGTGIGAAAGAVIGGIGGAIAGEAGGKAIASMGAERFYFRKLAEEEKEAVIRHLVAHYGGRAQ